MVVIEDRHYLKRSLYLVAGVVSLVAGVVGIVLPLLPTTPFVLLSGWCFARSSSRVHHWLMTHPRFGKIISDWHNHQGMTKANKHRACWLTALTFSVSIVIVPHLWLKGVLAVLCCAVILGISRINSVPDYR